ncbi:hypothetical protein [Cupriavidus sp. TMH.W2]|uniref:hypothetical protein n=1 Tax=Cupriavidus sp. TMH.W2 TaxID=3434465 RepID=UPI003D77B6B7
MGIRRVVVQQGKHLLYVEHIVAGARILRNSWRRVSVHVCPGCRSGRMYPFEEIVDGELRQFRGCEHCDHFEAVDINRDADSMSRLHALSQTRMTEMGDTALHAQQRKFRRLSRVWYLLAVLTLMLAGWQVLANALGLTFVFLLLFSVNLAVYGMAASYRYWQVGHRQLFVKGAFRHWLKKGEWIV